MIDHSKNNLPLDLSYLKEMSGDNAEFMIEMLTAFQEQTPLYLAELEAAVKAENWKSAGESAHKMKPTFFYFGRVDIRDFMQQMEHNAREAKNLAQIPSDLEELKKVITILDRQLAEAKQVLQERG